MRKFLSAGVAAAMGGVVVLTAGAVSAAPAPAVFASDAALPAAHLDDGVFAAGDAVALDQAQYVWGGRNYCWYGGGWHGPGWYWCGYARRHGFGWGGPVGWNGWRWRHGADGPGWRHGWVDHHGGWHGEGGWHHGWQH